MNVSQRCAPGEPFTVAALRQFVDQANRQQLPDDTLVTCHISLGGSITDLATHTTGRAEPSGPYVTPEPGEVNHDARTIIKRDSTGPHVNYRRWLRTRVANALILADVRALLAEIYDARLPADEYEIAALTVSGTRRYRVRYISARPRETNS